MVFLWLWKKHHMWPVCVFVWFGFVLAITYVLLCASQYVFISFRCTQYANACTCTRISNEPYIRKLVILKRCWDISLPYTHYIDQSQLRAHTHAHINDEWKCYVVTLIQIVCIVLCTVYTVLNNCACIEGVCACRQNMLKWMLYLYFFWVFHSFFLSMVECGCEVVSDFDWAVKQQFKICCKRLA